MSDMNTAKEVRDSNTENRKKQHVTHVTNLNSDINNPCVKEHKLSYKCLDDNKYDRDACQMYFINYQNCKDFWHQISVERRKKGIKPYLPIPEERQKIKEDFMNVNSMK